MTSEERDNGITPIEQDNITQLSFNITKYKNVLNVKENKLKGVSFYGE